MSEKKQDLNKNNKNYVKGVIYRIILKFFNSGVDVKNNDGKKIKKKERLRQQFLARGGSGAKSKDTQNEIESKLNDRKVQKLVKRVLEGKTNGRTMNQTANDIYNNAGDEFLRENLYNTTLGKAVFTQQFRAALPRTFAISSQEPEKEKEKEEKDSKDNIATFNNTRGESVEPETERKVTYAQAVTNAQPFDFELFNALRNENATDNQSITSTSDSVERYETDVEPTTTTETSESEASNILREAKQLAREAKRAKSNNDVEKVRIKYNELLTRTETASQESQTPRSEAQEIEIREMLQQITEQLRQTQQSVLNLRFDFKNLKESLDKRLSETDRKIFNRIKQNMKRPQQISVNNELKQNMQRIANTIPDGYRSLLGPAVASLLGGSGDMNAIAPGLLGLALAGPGLGGTLASMVGSFALSQFGINLNDLYAQPSPQEPTQIPRNEEKHSSRQGRINAIESSDDYSDIPSPDGIPRKGLPGSSDDVPGAIDSAASSDDEIGRAFEWDSDANDWVLIKPRANNNAIPSTRFTEQKRRMESTTANVLNNVFLEVKRFMPGLPNSLVMEMVNEFVDYSDIRTLGNMSREQIGEQLRRFLVSTDVKQDVNKRFSKGDIQRISARTKRIINDFRKKSENFVKIMSELTSIYLPIVNDIAGVAQQIPPAIGTGLEAIGAGARRVPSLLPRPTRQEVVTGARSGALGAAVLAGLTTGQIGGALRGIIPGLVAGAATGALTGGQVSNAIRNQLTSRGYTISPRINRELGVLAAVAPALIGAYLGYTPSGKVQDVVGDGILSGAGLTERKILIDERELKNVQAVEGQEMGKNEQWQPKIITPNASLALDTSQQEKYASDLQSSLFDYILPTSEGANGTVKTNKLKAIQEFNDDVRYYKSGIFIPRHMFNNYYTQESLTNDVLERLALGEKPLIKLPDMKFIPQDNETTFDTVAQLQFVNKENTAVGMTDPYRFGSNVDNFWMINPDSLLYTVNP